MPRLPDPALLDIDGTLVDSNEFHVLAWHRAFNEANMDIATDKIRKQIGKGADMLIPALAPNLPEEQAHVIAERHGGIFKVEYLHRVKAFPCAYELVEALHRSGLEVVLASSADQAEVDHYVHLLDIKQLLSATTSADDVENSKPAGDIFASALNKTASAVPTETLAIGDTPYDVIAAAKCQVRTIALRSGGFTEEELLQTGPVAIYDDVSDLFVRLATSPLAQTP